MQTILGILAVLTASLMGIIVSGGTPINVTSFNSPTALTIDTQDEKLQESNDQVTKNPSDELSSKSPNPSINSNSPKIPWGTTEKIGDHLYRTYVGQDEKMGTPEEILEALNYYRSNHGRSRLSLDEKLCKFSQIRADEQAKNNNLDSHKGFQDYLDDPKHWEELNFKSLGENASYGYILSGVHLIEWVFDADEEHRSNQLNHNWTHACVAISKTVVNVIFGQR